MLRPLLLLSSLVWLWQVSVTVDAPQGARFNVLDFSDDAGWLVSTRLPKVLGRHFLIP